MDFGAFPDLPQIQFYEENFLDTSRGWQQDYNLSTIGHPSFIGRSDALDYAMDLENGNCDQHPVARFMNGVDQPFSSMMVTTELMTKELNVKSPYEAMSPEIYRRQYSPFEGTEDSSLGCETFSAHSDELQQFSHTHRDSLVGSQNVQQLYYSQEDYSSFAPHSPEVPTGGGSCISLGQIQGFEDQETGYERTPSDIDGDGESDHEHELDHIICHPMKGLPYYLNNEDEGLGESIQDSDSIHYRSRDEEDDEDADPDFKPNSASSSNTRPKRVSAGRRSSGHRRMSNASTGRVSKPKSRRGSNTPALRPFPCPLAGYGCIATFTSKNEWKRHVSTQHIKLGYWRCDLCPPNDPNHPIYNDFNRKDLFTQHLRRMHATHPASIAEAQKAATSTTSPKYEGNLSDEVIAAHQHRCYKQLRISPLRSNCLFCPRNFAGEGSWEERMEHVGAHLERERKSSSKISTPETWRDDPILRDWLMQEGLVEQDVQSPLSWRISNGVPLR